MSNRTLIIVSLAAAASVVLTVAMERRSANQQGAQATALKEQAAQLAQAAAENARLTNLVARVKTAQSLSPEQLRDLLRLRNEIGQLRKLESQKAMLGATNARLREIEAKSQETLARARALPNYWPKDQLAFAGYGEPSLTVRSLLAALKNGDLNAMEDCFDPAIAAQFEADRKRDGGDPAAREAEIKTMWGDFLATADGFHLIDQMMTAPDEVTINLSFDGQDQAQKMVLRKTGNEWKVVRF